eukprot:GFKZ01000781.1.p2 GENE.GFKZ01000781.1~~GFKZ01000781.1.p2  ORF type:complete len:833 (+),score=105.79 GFKZ01000781.1:243-2501(+)
MEGQFATQALLVEQQRRIKHLEAELAQTQIEVMRLRNQVNPRPSPSDLPPHLHILSTVPMALPRDSISTTNPPPPASVAVAAAHAAVAAASMPQLSSQPTATPSPSPLPNGPGLPRRNPPNTPAPNIIQQQQPQEEHKKASSRYWTADEHKRFLEGLQLYGHKDIKAISRHVGTRSATQVRTHAQKYYLRIERERVKAEQEGKPPPVVPGTDHKLINGKHASGRASAGTPTKRGESPKVINGAHARTNGEAVTSGRSTDVRDAKAKEGVLTGARKGMESVNRGGAGMKGVNAEISKSTTGGLHEGKAGVRGVSQNPTHVSNGPQMLGNTVSEMRIGGAPRTTEVPRENAVGGSAVGSVAEAGNTGNPIPDGGLVPMTAAGGNTEEPSRMPMSSLPFPSQQYSQGVSTALGPMSLVQVAGLAQMSGPQPRIDAMAAPEPGSGFDNNIVQSKRERIESEGASMPVKEENGIAVVKESPLPAAAITDAQNADATVANTDVKDENGIAGEVEKELGKRPPSPLARKSPKKRLKKPGASLPLPPGSSAAMPLSSSAAPSASLLRPSASSSAGAPGRAGESKMYSQAENSGSMSNIRALLRTSNDDQIPGPSGSKPPALRRNESSNSVLADLSKNVGVLSRSNSFISPSGKGVTRSNSILSLLSGLPTAMRESPSSDRLLMLDAGEDRVLPSLKGMDAGTSGALTSQPGALTPGQTPGGAMGDRSFSFSQLQHMGLDDLEDASAVALALQEEQKWENG